jgi:uncharacterized protein (DUF2345 family)
VDTRSGAEKHHKDMSEAVGNLQGAVNQHEETARLAQTHNAQDNGADVSVTAKALHSQADDIRGTGEPHGELTSPHIVLSSPAGIALTTPQSTHIHTGENAAVSAGHHLSVSAGRSLLVSALDKVSLFAHKLGMKLFAGKGKVEIQAQSDDLDIIAEKVASFISAHKEIRISAPKEIYLSAAGSYIRIDKNGIEKGTNGEYAVYAKNKIMPGPKSKPWLNHAWQDGEVPQKPRVAARDELGRYLHLERYAKNGTQVVPEGATEHKLVLFHEAVGVKADMTLEQKERIKGFAAEGTILSITGQYANEAPEK